VFSYGYAPRHGRRKPHPSTKNVATPATGTAVAVAETDADDHIDRLAKKYLGKPAYPFRRPGEVRVTYVIKPEKVSAMR
jgi:hypothetical protein